MEIRKTTESDKAEICNVHIKAFGNEKGSEIADLVMGLMNDKTAVPFLSLAAVEKSRIIGHILYTKAQVTGTDESLSVRLLAPLAVLPDNQSKGVGGQLIKEGLSQLKKSGVDLVFVLGHPDYYPRSGFTPAGVLGYEAPYPIPEIHAGAWMVKELSPGIFGKIKGKVQCSEVLNEPQHWRE
ncbi:N-acetyltransferase [Desulfobacterales bacterium HSG17]|nr:N-acetyltransferase [Desulfobacterales bacterium HSG17]